MRQSGPICNDCRLQIDHSSSESRVSTECGVMEADDPSDARDAAVSPVKEEADSYAKAEEFAPSLGVFQEVSPSGTENVAGVPLSDGYQEDQAEEVPSYGKNMAGVSVYKEVSEYYGEGGVVSEYYEEGGVFLPMGPIPAPPAAYSVAGGVGARTSEQEQGEGQYPDPNAAAVAIDGSAAIDGTKITSEASSLAPPSVDMEEEEYSGMPKVDADIEVGKKIVRRRKLSVACPPSSFYSDVKPPAMELVQRALRGLKTTIRPFRRQQPRNQATEFHDEQGHMLLYGSLDGKFVGDALGGLPHGRGQHWTPSRGCKSAPKYRHLLYEGAWEYGAKTGYGRMFYHNGQEYRGHFKEGQRHGRGAILYLDGTVYDGEWFKGRRHGLGTSYYKDGGFYKGAWCKDNRDGWGAYYWPSKCRKYEGEWVGDNPVCGNHTRIEEWEYMALKELVPDWCNVKEYLPACLPKETPELPLMQLRNPECVYYPHACGRRQHRIDIKRAALKDPPDPKIVPEHKGSLSPQQMQALRLAFDKLSPGYYRRTMVNRIQIRRMILLARLDPDSEMGKRLFVSLQEAAIPTAGLTYNNFMKTILHFHYPREAMPYRRKDSPAKE